MPFRCPRCSSEIDKAYKACPHCGEPITEFLRRYADEPVDGKYQIVQRLGTGGMGEVYKVTHTFLGATRVIKVIRPQISESPDAHERFLREARIATRIQHPNVATLHDFSALPDGSHYMVWEYIDGENLAQRIRARGTLQPRYAVHVAIDVLHGLEAIHKAGIVHRDISPENIMLTREQGDEERVKLIDLGVAKSEEPSDNATRAGVFVGKLRYASPEHLGFLAEGERIDGRADLYSLGMVLYEMLTGRPPFEATSPHEYILLHSRETAFKPLDLPQDLPGGTELQNVLARALARDRNKRFSSAREFAQALEAVEQSLPDPGSIRTMSVPAPLADGDSTWRVTPAPDTLHRDTERSGVADAGPTLRTPLPEAPRAAVPAAPTLVTAERRQGSRVWMVVAVIALVAVVALAAALLRRRKGETPPAQLAEQSTTVPVRPPPQATVDVVSPVPVSSSATTTEPLLSAPSAATVVPTTTTAKQRKRPQPAAPPVEESEPQPESAPVPASNGRSYVDGRGADSGTNEQLMAEAQRQLRGVSSITVRTNGPLDFQLIEHLREEMPEVAITDGADVVVDFQGRLDRMGRGRKTRAARATVTKNGRVVFRYEMPPEVYRVGDTPSEAFARVLMEVLRP